MKLFPILVMAAGATSVTTSFDDAISLLRARYNDMKLRRVDSSTHLLKKKTRKMARVMRRRKTSMQNLGCWVSSVPYDFSLDIKKKCNIASTLMADVNAASWFFNGNSLDQTSSLPQCERFMRSLKTNYYDKYEQYFANNEITTCEVNLSPRFGGHGTAIGRVQGDAIIFDGIKYGEHQRFMRSVAADAPESNDLSQPSSM